MTLSHLLARLIRVLNFFRKLRSDHLTESQEILNLILHSAQTASARVSFFRVAFGSSGGRVSLGEARQLIENYFVRSKLEFIWKDPFKRTSPSQAGRAFFSTPFYG